jgi:succinate dehydrogenase / fumarate reductase cytochrome b subunit
MACLMAHLYHGAWSMFQTLGIDSPVWNKGLRTVAKVISVVLFIGFSSVPVATALNLMPLPSYSSEQSIKL